MARVRLPLHVLSAGDDLDDGQPVRPGECVVALIVGRDGMDGAGAVATEHVRSRKHRQLVPGQRMHRSTAEIDAD